METEDSLDDKFVQSRRVFVCGACGTMAHTNSRKRVVGPIRGSLAQALQNGEHELRGRVDWEDGVIMEPACPCGNDLYNTIEILQIHPDDESDKSHVDRAAGTLS